jgi:hypothetical protein
LEKILTNHLQRVDEAKQIFSDLENSGSPLNMNSFNSLMKVQMSCGKDEIFHSFTTFNEGVSKTEPNVGSYGLLMRAASLIQKLELSEEVYAVALSKFKNSQDIGISLHNSMLDNYAEAQSPLAYSFFNQMLKNEFPVNGGTFNAYAKACIFMDERHKLVDMVELMRVEGVLQMELSKPVRDEIHAAFQKYSKYSEARKPTNIAKDQHEKGIDHFESLRIVGNVGEMPWGRRVDIHSPELMKYLTPHLQKYTIDMNKLMEPKDLASYQHKLVLPVDIERSIQEADDPMLDALIVN